MAQGLDCDYQFKTLILGASRTGKSSLFSRYVDDSFCSDYKSTIGVDFKHTHYKISNKTIKLHLWDTSGSDNFHEVVTTFIRNMRADGALICFDLTNLDSFNHVDALVKQFRELGIKNAPIILVGCKADLTTQRVVNQTSAQEKAKSLNLYYLEVSSVDKINIESAFAMLIKQMYFSEVLDTLRHVLSVHFADYKKVYLGNNPSRLFSRPTQNSPQQMQLFNEYQGILNNLLLASSIQEVGNYCMQTQKLITQVAAANESPQLTWRLFSSNPLSNMLQKSLADLDQLLPYVDDFIHCTNGTTERGAGAAPPLFN